MHDINIKINRLGAVKDAEISLRPFMLLMGESGLGKSYVAFLAHYIYVILSSDRLNHFFDDTDFNQLRNDAKNGQKIISISVETLFNWINSDAISYIRYMVGHDNLVADVEILWPYYDTNIDFIYSEALEGLENDEELVYSISAKQFIYNKLSNQNQIDARVFSTLIQAILAEAVFGNYIRRAAFVLPPSRGALIELTERPTFRSGMYYEFFNLKNALNRPLIKTKEDDTILEKLLTEVNNGRITQMESQLIYTTSDGVAMPLTAAASSVKELAPFVMALKKFHLNNCSILFEEPEAHLHPQRQQSVADLIVYALNRGIHMQVTTHSDYFVKRLNLLIRLFRLRATKKWTDKKFLDFLTKINVIKETLLNPDLINAYYLSKRDDGYTIIRKYDIEKEYMIPFDSFQKAILSDFEISDLIDEFESADNSND